MHSKTILFTVALSAIAIQAAALPSITQENSVGAAQAQIMGMASSSLYRRQETDSTQKMTTEPSIASVTKENKHSVEVSVNDGDCDDKDKENDNRHKKHHKHEQKEDDEGDDDADDDDDDDDKNESSSSQHHGSSESSSDNHHDDNSQSNHESQSGTEQGPEWQHNAGGDHRNNEASPSTGYPGPNGSGTNSSAPPGPTVSHRPSSAIKTTLKTQTVAIASLMSIVITGYLF